MTAPPHEREKSAMNCEGSGISGWPPSSKGSTRYATNVNRTSNSAAGGKACAKPETKAGSVPARKEMTSEAHGGTLPEPKPEPEPEPELGLEPELELELELGATRRVGGTVGRGCEERGS
tara:strand:- start:1260 stop:1619 length:360 start_codon:yes stop_codon:yes gene_type:complete